MFHRRARSSLVALGKMGSVASAKGAAVAAVMSLALKRRDRSVSRAEAANRGPRVLSPRSVVQMPQGRDQAGIDSLRLFRRVEAELRRSAERTLRFALL